MSYIGGGGLNEEANGSDEDDELRDMATLVAELRQECSDLKVSLNFEPNLFELRNGNCFKNETRVKLSLIRQTRDSRMQLVTRHTSHSLKPRKERARCPHLGQIIEARAFREATCRMRRVAPKQIHTNNGQV